MSFDPHDDVRIDQLQKALAEVVLERDKLRLEVINLKETVKLLDELLEQARHG